MVGDPVLTKQPYANKRSIRFNPRPYVIINKKHSMLTATNPHTNDTKTHNSSHFVNHSTYNSTFNSKRRRRKRRLKAD